ncbi:MAG: hypothetical protein AAF909_03975 [Pseudomonadota bacterium]
MLKVVIGLVLAALAGTAAGNAALSGLFGVGLDEIASDLPQQAPIFAAALALPLLFWLVRGWLGWLFSIVALSVGVAAALKFGLEDDMPWDQALTLTAVYAVVAVILYRLTLGRLFS